MLRLCNNIVFNNASNLHTYWKQTGICSDIVHSIYKNEIMFSANNTLWIENKRTCMKNTQEMALL